MSTLYLDLAQSVDIRHAASVQADPQFLDEAAEDVDHRGSGLNGRRQQWAGQRDDVGTHCQCLGGVDSGADPAGGHKRHPWQRLAVSYTHLTLPTTPYV